jgi:hypothetical protein
MPVIREMVGRELLMLAVLAALGAGPASFLSSRFESVERVALAPIIGMCIGTSVFMTLLYFFPAADTDWLVVVLAAVSLLVALWRGRRKLNLRPQRPFSPRLMLAGAAQSRQKLVGWASLGLVMVLISAPVVSVLRSHGTVGPVEFKIADAVGYIAEADGEISQSLHDATRAKPPVRNLALHYYQAYAAGYQNLDLSVLSANVDSLAGLGATDTWEAFLVAFLVAGGLGALGSVRWLLREVPAGARTFASTVAGAMFGGALFVQLVFAESQAGTCGLCVLLPLAAIGADAVIEPRVPSLVLLAGLISGLAAIYPLFIASTAPLGALVLIFLALRRLRSGSNGTADALAHGALRVVLVVGLAVCMNLVSFLRDLRYWKALLSGTFSQGQGFVGFNMKASTLPAWLLQTRSLFAVVPWGDASFGVTLAEIVVPLLLLLVIVVALRRFPILCWLLVVIVVASALGEYEAAKNGCSYCTDRSLLPLAPLLIALVATGLAVAWASRRIWMRILGGLALLAWLVPAAFADQNVRDYALGSGTYLTASVRAVMAHLPPHTTVDVEGFDADPMQADPALAFAYELASEVSGGRATTPFDVNYNGGSNYFGGDAPLGSGPFNPNYRYVLTRLAGISTPRQVVYRSDGVALEKRLSPLDVTLDSGEVAPAEFLDPSGIAWVSNVVPLRFVVAGQGAGPAYVGVEMVAEIPSAASPSVVPAQPGVVSHLGGKTFRVCALATGTPPFRVATVRVTYNTVPYMPSGADPYGEPAVPAGLLLSAYAVASGHCPFGGRAPAR